MFDPLILSAFMELASGSTTNTGVVQGNGQEGLEEPAQSGVLHDDEAFQGNQMLVSISGK